MSEKHSEGFNSVIEHYQKIEGLPNKRADLDSMPKWLRLFWYCVMTTMVGGSLILIYMTYLAN